MRITIVGCGYVGLALARHWHSQGIGPLTLTTTRSERVDELQPLAERVLVLRAAERDALRQALEAAEVAVFCLAPGGDRPVDAAAYAATYRDSIATLVELLPDLPQLRHCVYTSSCSLYGDAAGGWVDESTPAAPRDDHGRVLLESEQLLEACRAGGRRLCLLRLGALYGPGRELVPRLRRLAGTSRPGSGAQHSNWVHRDDAAGAIAAAVAGGWDGLVNVVDDEPLPLATLLERFCRAAGEPPVRWDPAAAQGPAPADRRIRNRRLRQLGYELRHPRIVLPRLRRLDQTLFQRLAGEARELPRLRRNHNLHAESDAVQRFLNVLQPGTYVRPHRHRRAIPGSGFECFLVLQGSVGLLVLDGRGALIEALRLDAGGPLQGIELAEDQFHTLVALTPDAVLFEIKQGPYQPAADKDFLEAFPAEGSAAAVEQEGRWRALFESPGRGAQGG